ncbi:MAG: NERD domain-containing protein [Oscillospiraceae bacterium]|nr:NERD domain-containing protein [Oscillospiraceae bacterium]
MSAFVVIIIIAFLLYLLIKVIPGSAGHSYTPNRGKEGESDVSAILYSLPPEYHVLNDVTIPDQKTDPDRDYTTQIDHIVVAPTGIFVIETKNYSGWIFGDDKSKQWKQTFKKTQGNYFYNPVKQNWGHIFALAERLRLDPDVFRPIVVFSDNCDLHVESKTPVIYMSQLRELIMSYKKVVLQQHETYLIAGWLNKLNLSDDDIDKEHVQSIGERYYKRESSVEEGRCPRCGGQLVVRNGKYGAFYGCSNYPECTFTHDL